MIKKIAFISQVGDAMKSTLAAAVATEATEQGINATIVDLDREHRTAIDWTDYREQYLPTSYVKVPVAAAEKASDAIAYDGGEDLIVLDCPSRATDATVKIAKAADLIIQPIMAGSIKHARLAHETFEALAAKNIPIKKLAYILVRYQTQRQCADTRAFIEAMPIKKQSIQVIDTAIAEKPSYRQAISQGLAITEVPHLGLRTTAKAAVTDIITLLNHG